MSCITQPLLRLALQERSSCGMASSRNGDVRKLSVCGLTLHWECERESVIWMHVNMDGDAGWRGAGRTACGSSSLQDAHSFFFANPKSNFLSFIFHFRFHLFPFFLLQIILLYPRRMRGFSSRARSKYLSGPIRYPHFLQPPNFAGSISH